MHEAGKDRRFAPSSVGGHGIVRGSEGRTNWSVMPTSTKTPSRTLSTIVFDAEELEAPGLGARSVGAERSEPDEPPM